MRMRTTAWRWLATAVLAGEGIGMIVVLGVQIGALVSGDTAFLDSGIALVILSIITAAAVLAFAVAVWRNRSWGRSGGVVVQLLVLAVAGGAATGAYAHPLIGAALAVPALVGLVALFFASREARPTPEDAA